MGSFAIRTCNSFLILFIVFMDRISNCKESIQYSLDDYRRSSPLSKTDYGSLEALDLRGSICFCGTSTAALDFGGLSHREPSAIVFPKSVEDIVQVVRTAASSDHLTVAARGNGHSINGQAQALDGIVLEMSAMKGIDRIFEGSRTEVPYVDVKAGELWVDVLRATLRLGLAPRSWTDYLYLSVGGTLSNGGVSGQAFRFGPQINNVLQLDVVTGKGEAVTCSPERHGDLFYGALGGLGQFGIITKARIVLQRAPHMARWMRFVYSDFEEFRGDQELLISLPEEKGFDYIEGFVLANSDDPINGWHSVPLSTEVSFDAALIPPDAGPVLYCLETALNYDNSTDLVAINKRIETVTSSLHFIDGLKYSVDLPYFDFLNRVHVAEMAARATGTWDAPHPWLNLFVPRTKISQFDARVFKQILKHGVGGPMLLYPVNRSKWDDRMSAVVPDEDIFYLVALLRFNLPYPAGPPTETLLAQNEEILHSCTTNGIEIKQYLPHYKTERDWERHFGSRWHKFLDRKRKFDPRAILAPGQTVFSRISNRHSSHSLMTRIANQIFNQTMALNYVVDPLFSKLINF